MLQAARLLALPLHKVVLQELPDLRLAHLLLAGAGGAVVRTAVGLDAVQRLLTGGHPSLQALLFVQEQLVHLGAGRRLAGGFARLISRQRAVQVRAAAPAVRPAGAPAVDVVGRVGLRHAARPAVRPLVVTGHAVQRDRATRPLHCRAVTETSAPAVDGRPLLGVVHPLPGGGAALALVHAPAAGGVLVGARLVRRRPWLGLDALLLAQLVARVGVTAGDAGPDGRNTGQL